MIQTAVGDDRPLPSTVHLFGHPVQGMLVHFPIVCFLGTLVTDLVYWRTADMMWANVSAWLLAVGLVLGGLALAAGLVDLLANRRMRRMRLAWLHWIGLAVVLLVSLFNAFVHSRDAYTSVVPTGLVLSGVAAVLMLATAWLGGSMIYRHRFGAAA